MSFHSADFYFIFTNLKFLQIYKFSKNNLQIFIFLRRNKMACNILPHLKVKIKKNYWEIKFNAR